MGGISRVTINALQLGISDKLIIGVIISKQTPRRLKKEGLEGQRGVWDITVRDSPEDSINATFWGTFPHLYGLADSFHIGDVVDIINAKVTVRSTNDNFRPHVSSPFQLTMSDSSSRITRHEGEDSEDFLLLRKYPTKSTVDVYSIADIYSRGSNVENKIVDLLVVVRTVEAKRTITTKDGRNLVNRTIIVMDYTRNELPLLLWNPDFVNLSESWTPRDTVLFLADVKIEWNSYKRCLMAVDRSTTIITENPGTNEAIALRHYSWNVPTQANAILDKLAESFVDTSGVRQVMTIRQIQERYKPDNDENFNTDESHFTALVYCMVTQLDLDGPASVIAEKCSNCQLPLENGLCSNIECSENFNTLEKTTQLSFDLRVSLADHTGTLDFCRLCGLAAERILNCTVEQFMNMSEDEKTDLKWSLMLERCTARVLILRPSTCHPYPSACLLSCNVSDPSEVSVHVPLY